MSSLPQRPKRSRAKHAQRHADQTREVLRAYYSDPDYHETPILADREETWE